jgi:ribosomal protein S18 acetylase RimI-like enzyme
MQSAPVIQPARSPELVPAFRLIFRHLSAQDRETRIANALRLMHQNELDPSGLLVAQGPQGLLGAIICQPVPGASGLVWPPQAVTDAAAAEVEDLLIRHASAWLRQHGAKLAQAMLPPKEAYLAAPLLRNGFAHVTDLWYLRHNLDVPQHLLLESEGLTYQTYANGDPNLFHRTLVRTYEQTLDCPEVNGVRDIQEIITGHRAQGLHDPQRWWLALDLGRPVGVLLLAEMPECEGWDLAYVGVVPEARRRGFGRGLVRKALVAAHQGDANQLTLSVDVRNRPAWDLYTSLGFQPYDQREVYLAVWGRADATVGKQGA